MPITTTILKNTKQQTIIKIVGDGSTNIDLPNLAISSDTIDVQANLNVPITNLVWSAPDVTFAPIIIKRPQTAVANVYMLYSSDTWSLSQSYGISDTTNASSNIYVTMPASGATLFMTLSKPAGFIAQDLQANRR
jgi:hypothetical protein